MSDGLPQHRHPADGGASSDHLRDAAGVSSDWLLAFLAVADLGGFAKAAGALHRSQSRVSAYIGNLETYVGATLFDRSRKPVRLTEAGAAFATHARAALRHIERGRAHVGALVEVEIGEVKLGSYASASVAFLPGILLQFSRHHPQVRVHLEERDVWELEDELAAGDLGLILRPVFPRIRHSSIQGRDLWSEDIVAVVPDHGSAPLEGGVFPLEQLQHERIVSVGHARSREELGRRTLDTDALLNRAGVDLERVIFTVHPPTVVAFVRAGLGIGIANSLALTVTDTTGVRTARIDDDAATRHVGVYWSTEDYMSFAERRLLDLVLAADRPPGTGPPS